MGPQFRVSGEIFRAKDPAGRRRQRRTPPAPERTPEALARGSGSLNDILAALEALAARHRGPAGRRGGRVTVFDAPAHLSSLRKDRP